MVAYRDKPSGSPHLALVRGGVAPEREALVRVHEPMTLLDLIDTGPTRHSWPVHRALQAIAEHGEGVLVMLNCAQTGAQLLAQIQDLVRLGHEDEREQAARRAGKVDLRTYGVGAQILKDLGVRRMRLLAQPRKMPSMTGYDLEVVGFDTGQ